MRSARALEKVSGNDTIEVEYEQKIVILLFYVHFESKFKAINMVAQLQYMRKNEANRNTTGDVFNSFVG